MNILVSVITISYNSAKTIKRTIDSVLQQSYKNIEYIIIDGGSTDGTLDIIKSYGDKISKVVSEKDNGIADAMNKGIALAEGELIGIIHSNDWYELDAIESVVFHFESGEVFHGNVQYWNANSKAELFHGNQEALLYEMTVNHLSVFVKTYLYSEYGRFDTRYKLAMDYEFLLRLKLIGVRFLYLNKTISNMSLDGISDRKWMNSYLEVLRIKRHYKINFTLSYFCFQVLRKLIGILLSKMGLKVILRFYRQHFSIIKKV